MGVFNTIVSDETCPKCGAAVEWQSKELTYSGLLLANAMETIELRPEMEGEMHAVCNACRVWLEAAINNGRVLEVGVRELQSLRMAESPAAQGREQG